MTRPMRIGFVYDALYPFVSGGAERRYHELARRLSSNHEVHYFTWQWWDGPRRTEIDGLTVHGVGRPPKLYGSDGKRTVREALSFATRVFPALVRHRLDVIDCSATPYLPLYAAAAASRLTRTPLVATWHEFWGDHWPEYLPHRPVVARMARTLERVARGLGDRTVAVSPFTLERMGEEVNRGHIVVPNGVDLGTFFDDVNRSRGQEWDIAYVGRLIDEKRVDLLIDAVGLLLQRFPSIRCAVVGDGPARADLQARVVSRGLQHRVRFLGHLPQEGAIGVLRDARVFAMPSEREGFAITVIEAMACGAVPVVVSGAHTAAPHLIHDGVDGSVCDPHPVALAAAIGDVLGDEERLDGMRIAARAAAKRFDWDEIALEMEVAYRTVVKKPAPLDAGRPVQCS